MPLAPVSVGRNPPLRSPSLHIARHGAADRHSWTRDRILRASSRNVSSVPVSRGPRVCENSAVTCAQESIRIYSSTAIVWPPMAQAKRDRPPCLKRNILKLRNDFSGPNFGFHTGWVDYGLLHRTTERQLSDLRVGMDSGPSDRSMLPPHPAMNGPSRPRNDRQQQAHSGPLSPPEKGRSSCCCVD
jgi:hypothetical protein